MILRIRPYLIFLLMLLQFAAPLLHAHKNSVENAGFSVHLPEFEHVNTLSKHAPEFIAPTNYDDEFIAISTGIKNESLSFFQIENTIFVFLISLFFVTELNRKPCQFLFQTEPIPDAHLLNLASPRAPPFFTFR